jgi:hypothetical protein
MAISLWHSRPVAMKRKVQEPVLKLLGTVMQNVASKLLAFAMSI